MTATVKDARQALLNAIVREANTGNGDYALKYAQALRELIVVGDRVPVDFDDNSPMLSPKEMESP